MTPRTNDKLYPLSTSAKLKKERRTRGPKWLVHCFHSSRQHQTLICSTSVGESPRVVHCTGQLEVFNSNVEASSAPLSFAFEVFRYNTKE